ncbi:FAST kinase domain-containing protein 4-like [Homarus americanus]|uniref:FAST kinase domain-containing protein 4-like n=1 Tax=Homarus americanus TaxID=6706 RepID=UPI001C494001|nr:FAST kinase domain-containing protein 4-like [Homarus americanus]
MLKVGCGVVAACLRGARSRVQWSPQSYAPVFSLGEVLHLSVATATTTTSNWRPLENQDEEVSSSSVIKAKDVPVLLQAATNGGSLSSAFQGLQTLSDWVSNKKIDFKKDVENEEQFTKLIDLIDRGTIRSSPVSLLMALKSLMKLGVESNSHVVQSIENQLLWNIRKVSFSMLVSIMVFQVQHQNTELQKKVLKESLEAIQRRWVEIRAAPEIEAFYNHQDLYTSEFLGHVDDRTIELASEMNYVELSKIFCVLGTIKRRATPVIRALAFHMAKQVEKLTPKQLCNVLFAMNTLNFPDPVLLEKVAQDLVPQVTDIDKPKLVGSLLFCMGQMRWRHTSLLEVLSEWIEKNMQVCPMITLTAIINTLSTVSYMPSNSDSLFNVLVPKLIPSAFVKKTAWLDVVWSLCVLDRATEEHISSVLEPSFVSNIPSADQHLRMGIKLKLLNINAVAKLKMASYNGSYLDLANFKDVIITKGRDDLKLSKHIQIMLHNFLPPPRYIRENIQTTMGICVNAELLTDKKGKPLPIQDYSKSFGEYDNCKPLPEGAVKLALFVWGYRDYTIGSQELIGINKLAMQLLEKQDYKVVNIPFYEYNVKAKTLKNVQYLETKIKEAVES